MKALKTKKVQNQDLKIDLLSFIKLFKTNEESEKIAKVVKEECMKRTAAKITEVPNSRSAHLNKTETNNFTISMKTDDELAIIEIPIDHPDTISIHTNAEIEKGDYTRVQNMKVGNGVFEKETILNSTVKPKAEKPKAASIPSNTVNIPSLTEQMALIRRWWILIDEGKGEFEIHVHKIANFLCKKNIASNIEKAKRIINKACPKSKTNPFISFEGFSTIFCKGIFKEALIQVTNNINDQKEKKTIEDDDDLSLPVQLSQY